MFSYWEQNTFIRSPDVIIIGSGIVGLNAAIDLKKESPSLHILVLERGILPYGASTKNAGFACFGSASELLADLDSHPASDVFSLVEKRWKGLLKLRERVGDINLKYEPFGGHEVFTEEDELLFQNCSANLELLNNHLLQITNVKTTYRVSDARIKDFGFNHVSHIIENISEGQIDSGEMMKTLLQIAKSIGVEVLNGVNVKEIKGSGEVIIQSILDSKTSHTIHARRVLICVNGFAKKFLPQLDVVPGRAQVLITSAIENLKIKGSFHYDRGYYYFRNVGNRLLLGGGRNLDFDGETTEEFTQTTLIQERLEKLLKEIILPDMEYKIDMRWSGIMGLGAGKDPIVQQTGDNIFCAVRMGGMGIAIGSLVGSEAAEMVLQSL